MKDGEDSRGDQGGMEVTGGVAVRVRRGQTERMVSMERTAESRFL